VPYNSWKKLYVYDAKTQKVRQLTFGYPPDMDRISDTDEEPVEAAKDMRLDTTLQSLDGYELSYDGYRNSGLLGDMFWGGGNYSEPRLKKGSSSVRLTPGNGTTGFPYGPVEFVGWNTAGR
jgi:hypothetical protein